MTVYLTVYPNAERNGTRRKMHYASNQQEYQIRIIGHLPTSWSDWFDDMSVVQQPDGVTIITGIFVDQAALFGLLWRIRDLGLPLLSVCRIGSKGDDSTDASGVSAEIDEDVE